MIGAPFSSFGMIAELTPGFAVNACSNSVERVGGFHVPTGDAATFHDGCALITASYPSANSVALLSLAVADHLDQDGLLDAPLREAGVEAVADQLADVDVVEADVVGRLRRDRRS